MTTGEGVLWTLDTHGQERCVGVLLKKMLVKTQAHEFATTNGGFTRKDLIVVWELYF